MITAANDSRFTAASTDLYWCGITSDTTNTTMISTKKICPMLKRESTTSRASRFAGPASRAGR